MDPLSISTGIITLLGAVQVIIRGLVNLKDRQNAPAEIALLVNEISNFSVLLEAIRAYASEVQDVNLQNTGFDFMVDQIALADNLLQEMKKWIEVYRGGQEKSLHRWSRIGKRAGEYSQRLRDLRDNIHSSLTVLQGSSQRRTFSTVFLRLDKISAQVSAGTSALRVLQDGQTHIQETVEHLAADLSSNMVETVQQADRVMQDDGATDTDGLSGAGQIYEAVPDPSQSEVRPRRQLADEKNSQSALLISATVGHCRCQQWCPCQCHTLSRLTTPNILRSIFGSWLVMFSNLAVPTTRRCDYHRCRKSQVSSFNLSYYFPTWMLARVFNLIGTWKDLSGLGLSIVVRMPRVRPEDAPLFRYIEMGNEDAIKTLLAKGEASPFDVTPEGKSCLWRAAIFGGTDDQSWSSHVRICQLLINQGADVNAVDRNGYSATCGAFETMVRFSKHATAMEIRSIFPIDEFLDSKGPGFTLVHKIVTGVVTYLRLEDVLRADDRDVVAVDNDDRSPLFYGAEVGDADTTALLLRHGAEVNRRDKFGNTALMAAAWFGHAECVTVLLEAGADVHNRNDYDETALFFSTQAGHTDCVVRILQGGDGVNTPLPNRLSTILHTAVYYGHSNVVDLLLDHGADAEARDNAGRTPLALALFWGFGKNGTKLDQVSRRLRQRGAMMDFVDGFECRSHRTDACYCMELIAELLATGGGQEPLADVIA